jgi:hypothetical protein
VERRKAGRTASEWVVGMRREKRGNRSFEEETIREKI